MGVFDVGRGRGRGWGREGGVGDEMRWLVVEICQEVVRW